MAISPQLPEHNRELIRTRQLTFDILTDRGNGVATTFGLRFELPDYLRQVYGTFPLDLEKFNGTGMCAVERRNVMKTIVMIVGLAVFTGASVACFGLFSDRDRAGEPSCQELSGQEKTDCEQGKGTKPR